MRTCRDGPQPNEFVLSAAINACGAAGQWQEALKLLDDVQGVPPHQRVYNAAVAACDKGGQPEAAVRLLRRMRAAGVELDVFSYSSAMSACCRVPRAADGSVDASRGVAWRTALRLLRTMRGTGVRPNAYTYSSAMTACERGGCWEEALLLLGDMRADRVEPNRVVYTAAIGACGSQGQWVQALRAPPALTIPAVAHLPWLWLTYYTMAMADSPWLCVQALTLFRTMRRQRIEPDAVCYEVRGDHGGHARTGARTRTRTHARFLPHRTRQAGHVEWSIN